MRRFLYRLDSCIFSLLKTCCRGHFFSLTYSLVVIPLPIFFAGLIFSTTFRDATDPSLALGSNLLGAMVGGFAEYLGMIMGMKALLLIVLLFYLSSLWARLRPAQAHMSAESSR